MEEKRGAVAADGICLVETHYYFVFLISCSIQRTTYIVLLCMDVIH